jgi:hypothetical protein
VSLDENTQMQRHLGAVPGSTPGLSTLLFAFFPVSIKPGLIEYGSVLGEELDFAGRKW